MANKVNKVVDRNGNVLMDLTNDTVSANKVLSGTKFHGPDGKEYTGTLPANELDTLKYNFIDYDGTLLYTFTDDELDALVALPAGPNHTDENLTFQEWNWTLESLKAWDRTRTDRPIVGANLITTDGKTYLYIDTPLSNGSLSFNSSNLTSVDWGDGTTDSTKSHTYSTPGKYTVVIDAGDVRFSTSTPSATSNIPWITKTKLGNVTTVQLPYFYRCKSFSVPTSAKISNYGAFRSNYLVKGFVVPNNNTKLDTTFTESFSLETVSLPYDLTDIGGTVFYDCHSLKNIIIHDGVTNIGGTAFNGCKSLTNITIPNSVTSVGSEAFSSCSSLRSIVLSDNLTNINNYMFSSCNSLTNIIIPNTITSIGVNAFYECKPLSTINIPNSVTSISSNVFYNCRAVTLDLSEQTKVVSLTNSIGLVTNYACKILVPAALLDQYKSASYWSNYASIMVGV